MGYNLEDFEKFLQAVSKLCPGKLAHYYALLMYHGMEEHAALKEA